MEGGNNGACTIVRDPGTVAITGAYTLPAVLATASAPPCSTAACTGRRSADSSAVRWISRP
ncbi:MAG: hypothetical protein R2856_33505 [Caldilineaceae bacterium]